MFDQAGGSGLVVRVGTVGCLQQSCGSSVWCVPGVSLLRPAAGVPLGIQQEDGIEACSGFMS